MTSTTDPRTKVWERVTKTLSGCWLWQGAASRSGYGHLSIDGKTVLAHRVSWELASGRPVPAGLRVLHQCDVKLCVNPRHLHTGTAADKSREMVDRGRQRGLRKLTDAQVSEARSLAATGVAQAEIGRRLGVSQGAIWMLLRGLTHSATAPPPTSKEQHQ